ncbi:hypothetical protein Tco_1239885 [Tanacetum coccineum]
MSETAASYSKVELNSISRSRVNLFVGSSDSYQRCGLDAGSMAIRGRLSKLKNVMTLSLSRIWEKPLLGFRDTKDKKYTSDSGRHSTKNNGMEVLLCIAQKHQAGFATDQSGRVMAHGNQFAIRLIKLDHRYCKVTLEGKYVDENTDFDDIASLCGDFTGSDPVGQSAKGCKPWLPKL